MKINHFLAIGKELVEISDSTIVHHYGHFVHA